MKLLIIGTILTFSITVNANHNKQSESLINKCLSLHTSLSQAFKNKNSTDVIRNASFYYQNVDKGFKGICSTNQFLIEGNKLQDTVNKQQYIYLWSTNFNAETKGLTVANIDYTLTRPKNISTWLVEKI